MVASVGVRGISAIKFFVLWFNTNGNMASVKIDVLVLENRDEGIILIRQLFTLL